MSRSKPQEKIKSMIEEHLKENEGQPYKYWESPSPKKSPNTPSPNRSPVTIDHSKGPKPTSPGKIRNSTSPSKTSPESAQTGPRPVSPPKSSNSPGNANALPRFEANSFKADEIVRSVSPGVQKRPMSFSREGDNNRSRSNSPAKVRSSSPGKITESSSASKDISSEPRSTSLGKREFKEENLPAPAQTKSKDMTNEEVSKWVEEVAESNARIGELETANDFLRLKLKLALRQLLPKTLKRVDADVQTMQEKTSSEHVSIQTEEVDSKASISSSTPMKGISTADGDTSPAPDTTPKINELATTVMNLKWGFRKREESLLQQLSDHKNALHALNASHETLRKKLRNMCNKLCNQLETTEEFAAIRSEQSALIETREKQILDFYLQLKDTAATPKQGTASHLLNDNNKDDLNLSDISKTASTPAKEKNAFKNEAPNEGLHNESSIIAPMVPERPKARVIDSAMQTDDVSMELQMPLMAPGISPLSTPAELPKHPSSFKGPPAKHIIPHTLDYSSSEDDESGTAPRLAQHALPSPGTAFHKPSHHVFFSGEVIPTKNESTARNVSPITKGTTSEERLKRMEDLFLMENKKYSSGQERPIPQPAISSSQSPLKRNRDISSGNTSLDRMKRIEEEFIKESNKLMNAIDSSETSTVDLPPLNDEQFVRAMHETQLLLGEQMLKLNKSKGLTYTIKDSTLETQLQLAQERLIALDEEKISIQAELQATKATFDVQNRVKWEMIHSLEAKNVELSNVVHKLSQQPLIEEKDDVIKVDAEIQTDERDEDSEEEEKTNHLVASKQVQHDELSRLLFKSPSKSVDLQQTQARIQQLRSEELPRTSSSSVPTVKSSGLLSARIITSPASAANRRMTTAGKGSLELNEQKQGVGNMQLVQNDFLAQEITEMETKLEKEISRVKELYDHAQKENLHSDLDGKKGFRQGDHYNDVLTSPPLSKEVVEHDVMKLEWENKKLLKEQQQLEKENTVRTTCCFCFIERNIVTVV